MTETDLVTELILKYSFNLGQIKKASREFNNSTYWLFFMALLTLVSAFINTFLWAAMILWVYHGENAENKRLFNVLMGLYEENKILHNKIQNINSSITFL